jgi:hypothetical protein
VGSPERIKTAAQLMIDMPVERKMVVVSAMGTAGKGIPKARRPAAQAPHARPQQRRGGGAAAHRRRRVMGSARCAERVCARMQRVCTARSARRRCRRPPAARALPGRLRPHAAPREPCCRCGRAWRASPRNPRAS